MSKKALAAFMVSFGLLTAACNPMEIISGEDARTAVESPDQMCARRTNGGCPLSDPDDFAPWGD